MFKKIDKQDVLLKTFVVVSIIIFALFTLLGLVFVSGFRNSEKIGNKNDIFVDAEKSRFFMNEEYVHKDPFTTKIPSLKDMIKGPIISDIDPGFGDINSPVTVVIFSDFECSFCAKQEKILKEAVNKYKLRLIWKDYPGNDINSRSYRASVAARCAQRENAFWGFHDYLYFGEYSLNDDGFRKIAMKMNLDMDEFGNCLDKSLTAGLINDNMQEAIALDITGVPFIYVNEQEILGEISKEDLEKIIELELKR